MTYSIQHTSDILAERAHVWNLYVERGSITIFYAKWVPDSLILLIKASTVILFPFCFLFWKERSHKCCHFGYRLLFHLLEKGYKCLLLFAPLHFLLWRTVKKNTLKQTLETAVLFLEKSITIIHLLFEEKAAWSKAELL